MVPAPSGPGWTPGHGSKLPSRPRGGGGGGAEGLAWIRNRKHGRSAYGESPAELEFAVITSAMYVSWEYVYSIQQQVSGWCCGFSFPC